MILIPTALNYELRHDTIDPIPPFLEHQKLTQDDLNLCIQHEYYQRGKLHGFTLASLRKNGCFGRENANPSNFGSKNFHPIYKKDNWITTDLEHIGHGIPGQWDLWNNAQVKDAFMPCLYLASEFLNLCIRESFWYDGLLFGKWNVEPQPSDGCPPTSVHHTITSFDSPDPIDFNRQSRLIDRIKFSEVGNRVTFRIASGILDPAPAVFGYHRGHGYGMNDRGPCYLGGSILIASEMVLPLLQSDLTPSERLVQQLCVATTLLHETMHATGHFAQLIDTPPRPVVLPDQPHAAEPFFEKEEVCELGYSWENSFFCGKMGQLHQRQTTNLHLPALGTVLESWPSYLDFGDGKFSEEANNGIRYRCPENFQNPAMRSLYPLPSLFMEELQQTEFWDAYVPRFGISAMTPPVVYGLVLTRSGVIHADGLQRDDWEEVEAPQPNNPNECQAWLESRRQAIRAEGIMTALRNDQIWQEMEAAKTSQNLLTYLNDAVQTNKGQIQSNFLNEVRRRQAANEKSDDLLALLRGSQVDHIRVQALFLSSRLSYDASRDERLRWAALAVLEAQTRKAQTWLEFDWNLFVQEAEMEVKLIEQEIAIYGP